MNKKIQVLLAENDPFWQQRLVTLASIREEVIRAGAQLEIDVLVMDVMLLLNQMVWRQR